MSEIDLNLLARDGVDDQMKELQNQTTTTTTKGRYTERGIFVSLIEVAGNGFSPILLAWYENEHSVFSMSTLICRDMTGECDTHTAQLTVDIPDNPTHVR